MKNLKTFDEFVNENYTDEELVEGFFAKKVPGQLKKEIDKLLKPLEKKYGGVIYQKGDSIFRYREKVIKINPDESATVIVNKADKALEALEIKGKKKEKSK